MEENFIDLLEEYLDEEEIELKKRQDDLEDIQGKYQNQTDSNFSIEDSITIDRYVNEYLGIQGDCSNLFHSGLKDLECEYVMGVDNNFANKNPELVHTGYLLLVRDARNNRGTYINPRYLREYITSVADKELKAFYKKRVQDFKKIDILYNEYQSLVEQVKNNEKFYKLIVETHKKRQLNELEMRENDDQHKRR